MDYIQPAAMIGTYILFVLMAKSKPGADGGVTPPVVNSDTWILNNATPDAGK